MAKRKVYHVLAEVMNQAAVEFGVKLVDRKPKKSKD